MTRKDFFARVGFVTAGVLLPACITGLAKSCSVQGAGGSSDAPSNVDFTEDISSGALATNGGYMVTNGIIIARTLAGAFIAVSASCTHQGATVQYENSGNDFFCPRHGAKFSNTGNVTQGPANSNLKQYKTALTGNTLRIYS